MVFVTFVFFAASINNISDRPTHTCNRTYSHYGSNFRIEYAAVICISWIHLLFFEASLLCFSLAVHHFVLLGLQPPHLGIMPLAKLLLKPNAKFRADMQARIFNPGCVGFALFIFVVASSYLHTFLVACTSRMSGSSNCLENEALVLSLNLLRRSRR